jgi:HK97 family phage prohead protease
MAHYDFSGYATKNNIRCSDGRTIRRNAFIDNDGMTVPLVWQHRHNDPSNVLGHALLENREDGVFAYGSFNDTAEGQRAKSLVKHGDIKQLSIYANGLKQTSDGSVMHGNIREVSLVLSGANPGAYIQTLDIQHSDDPEYDELYDAEIYSGEPLTLSHSEDQEDGPEKKPPLEDISKEEGDKTIADVLKTLNEDQMDAVSYIIGDAIKSKNGAVEHSDEYLTHKEDTEMANGSDKTVQDVLNELTEEQMNVVAYLIGEAVQSKGGEAKHSDYDYDEEDYLMHTNVFEQNPEMEFLAHADAFFDDSEAIFAEAKKSNSLKDVVLAHAQDYGIEDIDLLFPDDRAIDNEPDMISRDQAFVKEFMDRVHKSPFARIKSIHADITEAEARAKGYVKGTKKLDEVFKLLKRSTAPTTVYKHQKLDRNDIIDITGFDIIVFLKKEMRLMLNEELVRAMLVGDGRSVSAADKIDEQCIRPIWTDDDLYTIKQTITFTGGMTDNEKARAIIVGAIKARKNYRGKGSPIFFTTEDTLTMLLLATDTQGRDLYDTPEKLATKLRVAKIVTSEILENLTRTDDGTTYTLVGIIVNPNDYNVGSDKGGEVSLFEDFDIDFNQQKYLIETRLSGALVHPYSAIALESVVNPT